MGAGEHTGHDARPGMVPAPQVTRGVPDHGHVAHVVHTESQHGGEHQVRGGASPHPGAGSERSVNEVIPAEAVDDALLGLGGEPRGETHPHVALVQRGEGFDRTGEWGDIAVVYALTDRHLEPGERRLGPLFIAEEMAEHLNLRLSHRVVHVAHPFGVSRVVGRDVDGGERVEERRVDKAAVGDGGARHVQHGECDPPGGHVAPTPTGSGVSTPRWADQVCSAMAGDSVMPRPPGPVITHTPSAGWSRQQIAPSATWE